MRVEQKTIFSADSALFDAACNEAYREGWWRNSPPTILLAQEPAVYPLLFAVVLYRHVEPPVQPPPATTGGK